MDAVKKKIEGLKAETEAALQRAEAAEGALGHEKGRADTAESVQRSLENRIKLLETDLDKAEERTATAEAKCQSFEQRCEEAERKLRMGGSADAHADKLDAVKEENMTLKKKYEALDLEKEQLERKNAELRKTMDALEDKVADAERKHAQLKEEHDKMVAELLG